MEAQLIKNHIEVSGCFREKDQIKGITGRKWDPRKKAWKIPVTTEAINAIQNLAWPDKLDPKIEQEYNRLQAIQANTQEMKSAAKIKPIEPMPIKIKPYQHQIKGYNLGLINPSFALLAEMGTGKSLTAVAIASRRYQRGEVRRLLVVAPTSVCPVWPEEFEAATIQYAVQVLQGPTKKRLEKLKNFSSQGLQVAVINYEATWRMVDELKEWEPDMIIADESQRIKNHAAQQSKAMHKLGKVAKYKLILTGTPVQKAPLDFFSQYKFLNPSIFGGSYYAFRNRYAVMGGYGGHEVVSYQHLDELTKKAHSIAYRVTKKEALDLPPQLPPEYRYCTLEPKARKLYDDIRKNSYAELKNGEITATNVLTRLLRLQQATGGFIDTDDGSLKQISEAKLTVLRETVEDLIVAGKKVVIFARFRPEIAAIQKMLEGMKVRYSWIAGDVPTKDRGKKVKEFQEDAGCMAFVAQIQTAGLGITLHAADTAVFYSVDFNYANYEQARARIHRIGQIHPCTYIHILAEDTIDRHVLDVLEKKENMARKIVDDWEEFFKK